MTRRFKMDRARQAVSGWALVFTVAAGACAPKSSGVYGQQRAELAGADDFGMLLVNAGLRPEALPASEQLTVDEARRLRMLLALESADGGMQRYGPRMAASYVLSEVITGQVAVSRAALNGRLLRFAPLAVLRPDGYLVTTLTGSPLQCAGPVQVQHNELRAGEFKLGAFYTSQEGGFHEDASLPPLPHSAYFNGMVIPVEQP